MDFLKSKYKLAISAAFADHLPCIYCCTLLCVNGHNARTVWMHVHTSNWRHVHILFLAVCTMATYNCYHTLTYTHSHTHTDGPRAALAVVDWPWKHQVWQTLTSTQISMCVNTLSMTTTLTLSLTNTTKHTNINVPWSGREKIEWAQLSAWANTQTHIYSININTSAFTSHMHKHLSTSHVNMSQGLQCHYIPMQTVFFHYEGTPNATPCHHSRCATWTREAWADILHTTLKKRQRLFIMNW